MTKTKTKTSTAGARYTLEYRQEAVRTQIELSHLTQSFTKLDNQRRRWLK